ncbi:MAG: DUF1269 domain-containing protein [Acidimicrobiia bacterium]|nr:DUF1269 domain-containing protein [Acidimicrobiia bacterium]
MTTLERTYRTPSAPVPAAEPVRVERGVIAIEFTDVFRAHEAMLAAARLERRLSIVLNDASVVTRDQSGKVRINRAGRPTPAAAGLWAATALGIPTLWLFGWWAGLAAAVVSAAVAVLWSRKAVGLKPRFLRAIGARLVPGRAAGCFLVSHAHLTHVLAEVPRIEGRVVHSSLPDGVDAAIAEALDSV